LPEAAVVNLSIFDVRGQKIVTLVDERQPAGYKIARWDGRDDDGAEVSEGIYFTRMEADDYTATRKVVIVR
jgi:flagellar hook assembly protein FlgD